MKLRAERAEFAEAVGWATRTVQGRVTVQALAGVLLEADEGRLDCSATDLELSARISAPVQVEEPGRTLLPAKLLSQLVAKLPDAPVELRGDDDAVELRCGRATFRVRSMRSEDFPTLPSIEDDAPRGSLSGDAFARLVAQVARAAATDDARPLLTGVHLQADEGSLTAAATDSYRLAVRRQPWSADVKAEALVPARSLQEGARSDAEQVTIAFGEHHVAFDLGDRSLTTSLIEGSFPNYERLLPTSHATAVTIERGALVESLQRVAIIALGYHNTPVTLTFEDGAVDLQAGNQEIGDAAEALPAEIEGEGLTIAFNPSFLLAGLEATGGDRIRFELQDGLKPAVLRPVAEAGEDADPFTYLLMPMKIS